MALFNGQFSLKWPKLCPRRRYFDSVFILIKLNDSPKGKDEKGVDQFYGLNVGGTTTCLHNLVQWTVLTTIAITLSPKKIY